MLITKENAKDFYFPELAVLTPVLQARDATTMARPVTLFTGQWADLPLAELAPLAKSMGYDGLELACWGDHFNVQEALAVERYCRDKRTLLQDARPAAASRSATTWSGQAVCDLIDERHKSIVPAQCGATAIRKACGSAPHGNAGHRARRGAASA